MKSLFFRDHCGVLDVLQIRLTVFSPFCPGVHGRSGLCLQFVVSLPCGSCQTVMQGDIVCVCSCPVVLSSHKIWLKVFLPLHWWGMTVGMLYLHEVLCPRLPHVDHGLWWWSPQLGAGEGPKPSWLGVGLFSRVGVGLEESLGTRLCLVGTDWWTRSPLCTICFGAEVSWCSWDIRRALSGQPDLVGDPQGCLSSWHRAPVQRYLAALTMDNFMCSGNNSGCSLPVMEREATCLWGRSLEMCRPRVFTCPPVTAGGTGWARCAPAPQPCLRVCQAGPPLLGLGSSPLSPALWGHQLVIIVTCISHSWGDVLAHPFSITRTPFPNPWSCGGHTQVLWLHVFTSVANANL